MTLLATLIARDLRSDPADPNWPDRDRLLLPGLDPAPGLAFGAAVGQAIAERLLAARFGRSLVDHRIWLVAHPAELICGTGREAAHIAGALGLGRLTVLATLAHDDKALRASYAASGWTVRALPCGDPHAAEGALSACQRAQKPTLILSIGEAAASLDPPQPNARAAAARRAWLKRLRRHPSRDAFQQQLKHAGYGAITTEIIPAEEFYPAEDYHQQYLSKVPHGYCGHGGTGVSCPVGVAGT